MFGAEAAFSIFAMNEEQQQMGKNNKWRNCIGGGVAHLSRLLAFRVSEENCFHAQHTFTEDIVEDNGLIRGG